MASRNSINNYKHSAILIRGGKVISIGLNKNKAGCLADSCYEYKGWHAELDCLYNRNPSEIKGATLYVGGLSKGNNTICSKPCRYCMEYLKKFQLKDVYYSLPNGGYGRLEVI